MLSDFIRDRIRSEIDSFDPSCDIEEALASIDMSEFDDQIRAKVNTAIDAVVDINHLVKCSIQSGENL